MIAHVLLALLIQVGVGLWLRDLRAGAAAAVAWSVAREIAQAEYRWIEQFGGGLRANMPWWGGLDPSVWQKLDPWLDWAVPSAMVIWIAAIATRRFRRLHAR